MIDFATDRRPTRDQLRRIAEDYLSGAGSVTDDPSGDGTGTDAVFYLLLAGTPREPLHRAVEHEPGFENMVASVRGRLEGVTQRWVEVWSRETDGRVAHVTVTIRGADSFTLGVADRLAEVYSRFWTGTLTSPS